MTRFPLSPVGFLALPLAILEWLVLSVNPLFLQRLALIPVGRRFVPLPPGAAEALRAHVGEAANYRTAPTESFDFVRLAVPERIALPRARRLYFTREGAVVVASVLGLTEKSVELERATLSIEGDRIAIRGAHYPVGVLPFSVMCLGFLLRLDAAVAPVILRPLLLAIAVVVYVVATAQNARETLDRIALKVSTRLDRIATIRVAEDSGAEAELEEPLDERASTSAKRLQR